MLEIHSENSIENSNMQSSRIGNCSWIGLERTHTHLYITAMSLVSYDGMAKNLPYIPWDSALCYVLNWKWRGFQLKRHLRRPYIYAALVEATCHTHTNHSRSTVQVSSGQNMCTLHATRFIDTGDRRERIFVCMFAL